ncbi:MAG: hypothetical protein ABIQ15_14345, partial [Nocardioides sp.]
MTRRHGVRRLLMPLAVATLLLVGCGPAEDQTTTPAAPAPSGATADGAADTGATHDDAHDLPATPSPSVDPEPLRPGEERVTLAMPEPYTGSAPTGVGTDDYRCFLLDPGLKKDAFLTGTN